MERTSRSHLLGVLPGGHGAVQVLACLVTSFARVPRHPRRSLTWDQGRELACHLELAKRAAIDGVLRRAAPPPAAALQ